MCCFQNICGVFNFYQIGGLMKEMTASLKGSVVWICYTIYYTMNCSVIGLEVWSVLPPSCHTSKARFSNCGWGNKKYSEGFIRWYTGWPRSRYTLTYLPCTRCMLWIIVKLEGNVGCNPSICMYTLCVLVHYAQYTLCTYRWIL